MPQSPFEFFIDTPTSRPCEAPCTTYILYLHTDPSEMQYFRSYWCSTSL